MAMSQSSISRNRPTQLLFHFRVVQKDNHSIVSHLFRGFCKRKVSSSYFLSYNKISKDYQTIFRLSKAERIDGSAFLIPPLVGQSLVAFFNFV